MAFPDKMAVSARLHPGRSRVAQPEAFILGCMLGSMLGLICCRCWAQSSSDRRVESYLEAAQEAQSAGNIKRAIECYRQVLALKPDFPEVQANLGMMLYLNGEHAEAVKFFRAALRRNPDLLAAQLFLGMTLVKLGHYDLAVNPLREALKRDATNVDARLALCAAYSGEKSFEMAVKECLVATQTSPENPEAWYALGDSALRAAKVSVDNWATSSPSSPYVYILKGESYGEEEKHSPAILEYQKALGLSPRLPPGTHLALGELFLLQGNREGARKQFALSLMNTEPINYAWGMAQAALCDRNYPEFERWEKEIERLNLDFVIRPPWFIALSLPAPELTAIREDLERDIPTESLDQSALQFLKIMTSRTNGGVTESAEVIQPGAQKDAAGATSAPRATTRSLALLIENFQFADCVNEFRNLPEQFQSDARVLSELAECEWKIGEFEKSWQASLKARRADPRLENALYWQIKSLLQISKQAFSRLSRLPAGQGRVHELLAKADEVRGQDVKAVEEYRLALQLSPESVETRLSLAALQMRSLRYEEATESFREALKYSANDPDAHYGLGVVYVQLRQPQAAVEHLQRALQLIPDWPEAHASLGQAYRQLSQYREAVAELEKATISDRDGSIHLQLYQMYKKVGEEQKAKQALAKSVALREQSQASREKAIRQQLGLAKNE